jgi:hypothetical protein
VAKRLSEPKVRNAASRRLRINLDYFAKTYGLDNLLVTYVEVEDDVYYLVMEGTKDV